MRSKIVRAAAMAISPTFTAIDAMTVPKLKAFIKECDKLTTTNCWWMEYALAPLCKKQAEEALSLKSNKPKRIKAANSARLSEGVTL